METKCKVHSLLCDDDQVYYADTKRSVGTGGDGEVTGAGMGGDKSKCLWERVGKFKVSGDGWGLDWNPISVQTSSQRSRSLEAEDKFWGIILDPSTYLGHRSRPAWVEQVFYFLYICGLYCCLVLNKHISSSLHVPWNRCFVANTVLINPVRGLEILGSPLLTSAVGVRVHFFRC